MKNYSNPVFSSKDQNKLLQKYNELEEIGKALYRYETLKKNNLKEEADNEKENISNLVLKGGISNVRYIWHSENSENTCEQCQALDGTEYGYEDEIPERPHPNCQCTVEIVEDSVENNEESDNDDSDENTKGKPKKDKKNEEPCDCWEEIESLLCEFEEIISNFEILSFEVETEIESIEIISSDAETKTIEMNEIIEILEEEYELLILIKDYISTRFPLQTLLGTIYDFTSNYIKLLAEFNGTMDKYYHSKANCQSAQRGILGSIIATALSNLKESYDSYTYIHTHKVSIEEAIKDSMADQVANQEGRIRGRQNIDCECSTLMWDLKPSNKR